LKISFRFEKNLTVSSADNKIGRGFTRINECIGMGQAFAPTAWASAARKSSFDPRKSASQCFSAFLRIENRMLLSNGFWTVLPPVANIEWFTRTQRQKPQEG